ncbi:MAG: hypothetical protein JNJ46_03340 [Myxococcales bacterium]|nr:hypothetical protein [Myxococcales bacterium]
MKSAVATHRGMQVLHGERVDAYVEQAVALLQAAKLSAQYPIGSVSRTSPQGGSTLTGYLRAMGSRLHRGLYPQLEVELLSGFPSFKEWTRVRTDVDLCGRVLADLPAPEILRERAALDAAYGKQLLKFLYYSELLQLGLPPFEGMAIRLQRRMGDGAARFQLVLDKLDAVGLPLRCTAEISQQRSADPLITLRGDRAEAKRELWGMLYRVVSLDAELSFLQLQSLPGLHVHSVTIGTVGPLCCGSLQDAQPLDWPVSLCWQPHAAVLACAIETVQRSEQPELDQEDVSDRNNDPLSSLWKDALSAAARREYEQARTRYRYRIIKDRKFVADRANVAALKALCTQAGTQNLVYVVPP